MSLANETTLSAWPSLKRTPICPLETQAPAALVSGVSSSGWWHIASCHLPCVPRSPFSTPSHHCVCVCMCTWFLHVYVIRAKCKPQDKSMSFSLHLKTCRAKPCVLFTTCNTYFYCFLSWTNLTWPWHNHEGSPFCFLLHFWTLVAPTSFLPPTAPMGDSRSQVLCAAGLKAACVIKFI